MRSCGTVLTDNDGHQPTYLLEVPHNIFTSSYLSKLLHSNVGVLNAESNGITEGMTLLKKQVARIPPNQITRFLSRLARYLYSLERFDKFCRTAPRN
jgi:hypothetical protein